MFGDNVNLAWVPWTGSLPNGAVSIYNDYTKRTDYVCKHGEEAGFYSPGLGPYCHYPWNNREIQVADFQVLVNVDNFEVLEWKEGSYGSVPPHAVRTCPGVGIFVGKNKYGLGKVDTKNEAFFLPQNGKEYWYKTYQVLCINRDAYTQHISDVKYALDNAKIIKQPPEIMTRSVVKNQQLQALTEEVTLLKKKETENTWSIGRSTMIGVKSSITASIPNLVSGSLEVSAQETMQFNEGTTKKNTNDHKFSLTIRVPPKHSCTVHMEGSSFTVNIPFTARLSRTYQGGVTRTTSITGTFKDVQYSDVSAIAEPCKPLVNPPQFS